MIRGQMDSVEAQKKLAKAQSELSMFTVSHNEKTKQVLMSLAASSGETMKNACFHEWVKLIKQLKAEAAIRAEYEDQLNAAEERLTKYKAEQLKNIRGTMSRKAEALVATLSAEVFQIWVEQVEYEKDMRDNADKVAELEG